MLVIALCLITYMRDMMKNINELSPSSSLSYDCKKILEYFSLSRIAHGATFYKNTQK